MSQSNDRVLSESQVLPKETVVLIHGTFAAPNEKARQWYQPGSAFCSQLDARLSELGSPARCWAHVESDIFFWSGENSWIARSEAATRLARYLQNLTDQGWRCHVIAHSHGGNVLLEALGDLRNLPPWAKGNLVLIGTPILDVPHSRWRWSLMLAMLIFWGLLGWLGVTSHVGLRNSFIGSPWYYIVLGIILLLAVPVAVVLQLLLNRPTLPWIIETYGMPSYVADLPKVLIISSKEDEVFRLFSGIIADPNPFKPPQRDANFIKWLASLTRHAVRADNAHFPSDGRISKFVTSVAWTLLAVTLAAEPVTWINLGLSKLFPYTFALLLGVLILGSFVSPKSFLSSLFIPWRIFIGLLSTVVSIPRAVLLEYGRRRGWKAFQTWALGLERSPYPISKVRLSQWPEPVERIDLDRLDEYAYRDVSGFMDVNYIYESLPSEAETKAIEARRTTAHHVLDIVERKEWTTLNVVEALKQANDVHLVHAAYYTSEECIGRIGRWISITEEQRSLWYLDRYHEWIGSYWPQIHPTFWR